MSKQEQLLQAARRLEKLAAMFPEERAKLAKGYAELSDLLDSIYEHLPRDKQSHIREANHALQQSLRHVGKALSR